MSFLDYLVNLGQVTAFMCVLYCSFVLSSYISKWFEDNYIEKPLRAVIWTLYIIVVWFVMGSIALEYTDYDY